METMDKEVYEIKKDGMTRAERRDIRDIPRR